MSIISPPPIASPPINSFVKSCSTISLIAGIIAIPAIVIFASLAFVSAAMYQGGEGSIWIPVLAGMLGIVVHGAAVVAAVLALINKAPKGKAWAGIILNGFAAFIILIIVVMTSFA